MANEATIRRALRLLGMPGAVRSTARWKRVAAKVAAAIRMEVG
jgi:hypothetical protein